MSERFYIHCADDINRQLFDTESEFNIHIEEIGSDEELIKLCNLLNEQQDTIKQLEGKIKRLNAFIVSKDLAIEYLKWNKKGDV